MYTHAFTYTCIYVLEHKYMHIISVYTGIFNNHNEDIIQSDIVVDNIVLQCSSWKNPVLFVWGVMFPPCSVGLHNQTQHLVLSFNYTHALLFFPPWHRSTLTQAVETGEGCRVLWVTVGPVPGPVQITP